MFLLIDTSQREQIRIALVRQGQEILDEQVLKIKQAHSEKLLPLIEKILVRNKLALKRLKGLYVARGPGSFTGVRVGVATANALAYALNIPVKGVKCKEGTDFVKLAFQGPRGDKFLGSTIPYYSEAGTPNTKAGNGISWSIP